MLEWCDGNKERNVLRIINEASPKWQEIGSLIGISNPDLINIEGKQKDNTKRLDEVFTKWMQNGGNYPATWIGLQKVLEDAQLATHAERIKEALPYIDV